MMKRILLGLLAGFLALGAMAQGDFVSVSDLAKKLMDKNTIIVDARADKEYKQVHIRNAISMPVELLSSKTPVEGLLNSKEDIAKTLGDHGVDISKNLVLYCNSGNSAGRLYWILKMMGAENVKLLDGNLEAWKEGRKPVTKNPSFPKKCKVPAVLNTESVIAMADVKSKMKSANVVLVDARKDTYFNGTDAKSNGHIPGAVSIPSEALKDDKGLLKSADDLKKLFESKGVTKDKEVILYCQTSTRAGLTYMVLKTVLGYSNLKVYDGAYNEWAHAGNALEK